MREDATMGHDRGAGRPGRWPFPAALWPGRDMGARATEAAPSVVRAASAADALAITILQDRVFGQPNELRMTTALRARDALAAEAVAWQDTDLVGHLALAWLEAPQGWVAPLPAAITGRETAGLHHRLLACALASARAAGARVAVATGDPALYRAAGFRYGPGPGFETPFPAELTGLLPVGEATLPAGPVRLAYPAEMLAA